MSKAQEWLRVVNSRLAGTRVALEMSGKRNNISLRATLPPMPWEPDQRHRQRRVSLGISIVDREDMAEAEALARGVDLDLRRGEFDWTKFPGIEDPREPEPTTIGDWMKMLEKERRPKMTEDSWRYNYQLLMESLPMDDVLNEEALLRWVLDSDPEASTMRGKYVTIAAGLCEVAGIGNKRIRSLRKERSSKPVNPRDLPEDAAIVAMWEVISDRDDEWAWVYGMLATYGLRPHELFRISLEQFPEVRVLQNSKTGERIVPAIRPVWVEKFGLSNQLCLPQNLQWEEGTANWKLGLKIGQGFRRYKLGNPYDLRHCYARACLEVGLTSDVGAKLMGHSREIHERTYRAFIKSSVYVDAAKRAIARSN